MLPNAMRRLWLTAAFSVMIGSAAVAQEPVKIGLILPMTGPFTSTGKQISAAVRLYMQQHGDSVAGRKIEVTLKDDSGNPEATKRLAQELVVNSQASILAGFGLTPLR
jgi:branched-chain amino acid transport system substrate-binding protein